MGGDLIEFRSDGGQNNYRKHLYTIYFQAFKIFFNFSHGEQHAANKTPNSKQPKVFKQHLWSDTLLPTCILPAILVSKPRVHFFLKLNATVRGVEKTLRNNFKQGEKLFLLICFTLLADQSKGFVNI